MQSKKLKNLRCLWVDVERILPLRHEVIIRGTTRTSDCFDGDRDPSSRHTAACDGEKVVGCASFMRVPWQGEDAYQLRGMATHPDWQGCGVGRELLAFALRDMARDTAIRLFWCNARCSAASFYTKQGWKTVGDAFDIPGVGPHVRMFVRLSTNSHWAG